MNVKQLFDLTGRVAIVSGGSMGLGRQMADGLAEMGANLVLCARKKERCEEAAEALRSLGVQTLALGCDVKDKAAIQQVVEETLAKFGRVDILVNNAAVVHRATVEDASTDLWDEIFAVNVRAPFLLCQEAVRHMKERQSGCIVNIGSGNGYCGGKRLLPYSASKGALTTFTKNLANYLTQYRIRVNQLNPGWTLTEGERQVITVIEDKGEEWLQAAAKRRPSGRMLLPADVARAVLFFATNELISGAVLDYEQFPFGAPPD